MYGCTVRKERKLMEEITDIVIVFVIIFLVCWVGLSYTFYEVDRMAEIYENRRNENS